MTLSAMQNERFGELITLWKCIWLKVHAVRAGF